jgi:hypothetical protein
MEPGTWFPIIIIGMVIITALVFGIIMFLDKGGK